ncbi:MAG TPA: zf-HC2 domain-containing protein [Kofleriaceae bacterium]|nr:zf-HC2 domain-containing protein [Kofleriaceae bacterium]
MSCRNTQRLFSRHLDGRISDAERTALDAHLAGCAACRAELVRWELPSRALRAMGAAPVPEGLAERGWRAAIAAANRSPGSFEERFVWAARRAAAAGALAAALVWGGLLLDEPGSAGGSAELVSAPDAAEMAVSLWSADPGGDVGFEGSFDGE